MPSAPRLASLSALELPSLYIWQILISSNLYSKLKTSRSLELRIQFGVARFLNAFRMICESPSIIKLEIPKLMQACKPSSKAVNSAKLFVVGLIGFAFLAIHLPESSLMIQPIPATPGFPLAAPSKFNLVQPFGGGDHLQFLLAALSIFKYVSGGLIK